MANIQQSLAELMKSGGAMCAALVDYNSGMLLGQAGSGVDMELAAAGNTEVVRAKVKTMQSLGFDDAIEDILITLGKQYHILRPLHRHADLFIYVVLDKAQANLALARRQVLNVENSLEI